MDITKAELAAEFFGTFRPVFGGGGSAVISAGFPIGDRIRGCRPGLRPDGAAGVYAFGPISGGHFNPAVSLGLAVAGRFSWKDLVTYIIVQVAAAAVAAARSMRSLSAA